MAEIPFPGDTYTTPPNSQTFFASKLPTLSFLWKVVSIIRYDSKLAVAGQYTGQEWSDGSLRTLRGLEACGVTVHAKGMDNIDRVDGPCVFIGNHMSTLETFVLPTFIQPRKPVTFVVKESLLTYPWFGPVLQSRNPVSVGRKNPREDLTAVLTEGTERLQSGMSIIVFPQSTRGVALDPALFNSIGVKLAKRAGVPIIPIALRTDAWGVGKLIKDYGKIIPTLPVHFSFGEPITVSGNGKAEHAQVFDFITSHLHQWFPPVPVAS